MAQDTGLGLPRLGGASAGPGRRRRVGRGRAAPRSRERFRDDHDRREKPKRERREPGPDDKCNRCGEVGHWARDCPLPRDENAPVRERGPRQPKPDDVCKKCGQTGHWARDCPSGDGAKAADADGDANMDASALDNDLDAYKAEGAAADEAGAAEEMVDA